MCAGEELLAEGGGVVVVGGARVGDLLLLLLLSDLVMLLVLDVLHHLVDGVRGAGELVHVGRGVFEPLCGGRGGGCSGCVVVRVLHELGIDGHVAVVFGPDGGDVGEMLHFHHWYRRHILLRRWDLMLLLLMLLLSLLLLLLFSLLLLLLMLLSLLSDKKRVSTSRHNIIRIYQPSIDRGTSRASRSGCRCDSGRRSSRFRDGR